MTGTHMPIDVAESNGGSDGSVGTVEKGFVSTAVAC